MSTGKCIGRLHVITDETLQDRFSHAELARLVTEGGVEVIQYREKRPRSTRELIETAIAIARALEGSRTRLLIDDRVEVAKAAGVPAVHLGPHDLPAAIAREILGADAIIGGTANNLAEARAVAQTPVDYLGVGPVFGTESKANPAPTLGLDGLREIVAAVDKPVIAIGRITAERVQEVLATGAQGVAVLSAVVCQADPAAAAHRFRAAIDAYWGGESHG